jgi:hypothetical protein
MVRTIEENKREMDPVNSTLFLSSLNTWHNNNGLHCGVEKVGKIFKNKNNGDNPQVAVKISILSDMPKCRARIIDENGKIVTEYDEVTDKQMPKIEIIDDAQEVTFFMKLKELKESDSEEQEYLIHKLSSAYPLFSCAFKGAGEVDDNDYNSIIATHTEIVESLEGFEFTAKTERREFQGNNYGVLLAESPGIESEKVE